jgi:hypothetical protein
MKAFVIILMCSLVMMVFTQITQANSSPNADIICPDAVSVCQANTTCCIATDGDYSCCPIQAGICCSDHSHCCPEHYKCDLKIFKCDHVIAARILEVQPSLKKN